MEDLKAHSFPLTHWALLQRTETYQMSKANLASQAAFCDPQRGVGHQSGGGGLARVTAPGGAWRLYTEGREKEVASLKARDVSPG